MDVTNTPSAATPTATAATPAATASETSASKTLTADFQTFLKLLTTQMQNQDPLKPLDSTEFVAQLASFSTVEQQVQSNERLDGILEALGGNSASGLAAWIGREIRVPGKAEFSGKPVEVGTTPVSGADKAVLVVTNAFGTEIAKKTVSATASEVTWDGTDDSGAVAPNGTYSFKVLSYKGTTLAETTPGQVYAKVSEVQIDGGVAKLLTATGSSVALSDVTAVR